MIIIAPLDECGIAIIIFSNEIGYAHIDIINGRCEILHQEKPYIYCRCAHAHALSTRPIVH